jgi:hypothetical protein
VTIWAWLARVTRTSPCTLPPIPGQGCDDNYATDGRTARPQDAAEFAEPSPSQATARSCSERLATLEVASSQLAS